jgi:hypothetical protein
MANILLENASAWGKMKKGLVSDIRSASKKKITETVLENARRHVLQEHASLGATQASNVAVINKVMMPLIKRVMPTVMAHELVGVQPLTGPSGLITTMRVRYATTSPVDGTGIIRGQEALSPYLTGAWYSGNEDAREGMAGAADTAILEGVGGNEVNIEFVKQDVKAGTRRLKARFTLEAMQDAQSQYGANVEQELTSVLAQQIVVDIDQEILAKLRAIAGVQRDEFDMNQVSGVATSIVDEHAALAVLINKQSNDIARRTRQSSANWMVVSHTVLSLLQSAGASQFARTTEGDFEAPTNNKYVGTLNGSLKTYVNTYATDDDILIGYKGSDEISAAAYYCPYIPVMSSGTITDPNTFEHVMALVTRYGFVAMTNPANGLGNAADYLARIKVNQTSLRFI